MTHQDNGAIRAEERARISTLLTRYPALATGELDELQTWFQRAATPLDLGLLAGDPAIAAQYRAFRADHHDRFKPRDIGKVAIFVGAVLAVVGSIYLTMP